MPLFLFCSGLFVSKQFKGKSWSGVMANAIVFYVLYLLFYCAKYLISIACSGHPTFNPFYMNAGSWYLFVLATFLLISPLLSRLKIGWAFALAFLLSVSSCLLNEDRTFLSSSRFFTYLPWFVAGFFLSGDRLNQTRMGFSSLSISSKSLLSIAATAVLIGYFVALYLLFPPEVVALDRQLSTGLHSIQDIDWAFGATGASFVIVLGACRLLHYGLVAILCVAVVMLVPTKTSFLSTWGKNSLQVYIAHLLILYLIDGTCGLDFIPQQLGLLGDWWAVVFPIVGGIAMTWILSAPEFPNKMVMSLKRMVRGKMLSQ